jgi:hypothetical protein
VRVVEELRVPDFSGKDAEEVPFMDGHNGANKKGRLIPRQQGDEDRLVEGPIDGRKYVGRTYAVAVARLS